FDAPFFRDSALNRHGKFPVRLNQQLDIIPLDFISKFRDEFILPYLYHKVRHDIFQSFDNFRTTLGLAAVAGLFSPSFWILLAVRIVQASGAGAVVSLSMVTLSRYVPIQRRGKAMALIMSAVSLAALPPCFCCRKF
ncbi:hypothetical protein RW092_17495, partial [Paenibacillus sp. 3LSP]|uniref:MFS transporter n=1 Tax=Paenibacillus sp. 3LSP TaxID=2800795 RepID=UPI0028FD7E20|nr:hypothetical protein [Paenibacillus sp. 3LSP]